MFAPSVFFKKLKKGKKPPSEKAPKRGGKVCEQDKKKRGQAS